MCDEKFKGRYNDQLWAGMSVKDVVKHSRYQVALDGCVVVDGIGLPLPDGCDDFKNITDFLPLNFIFKHLSIFRLKYGAISHIYTINSGTMRCSTFDSARIDRLPGGLYLYRMHLMGTEQLKRESFLKGAKNFCYHKKQYYLKNIKIT